MLGGGAKVTLEHESNRLLEGYGPHRFDAVGAALERQFRTIHDRAQLLLGICGVLISASVLVATGRILASPAAHNLRLSRTLLACAGALNVTAAVIVVGVVLTLRWRTEQPAEDLRAWVLASLVYRDAKTRAYRVAVMLVLLSMLLYQAAVTVVLLQA